MHYSLCESSFLNFIFSLQRRPTSGTLNEDLLTIAREVLVERPAKFIRRMRQGIPEEFAALFFSQLTVEKVTVMYVKLRPTAAAVAACIIAENEAMMRAEDLRALQGSVHLYRLILEDKYSVHYSLCESSFLNFIFSLQRRPTSGTLNEDLLTIAREVLVERPAKFIRRMRQGIPEEFAALFFSQLTVEKVTVMYVKLRPTAAAVAACIIAENEAMMRAEDLRALHMFRSIVRAMEPEELADFLLCVTGSEMMPQDNIKVAFFQATVCPVCHMCGPLVELPTSYTSRAEMKRE